MKGSIRSFSLSILSAITAIELAYGAASGAALPGDFKIVDRGLDHRVWERTITFTAPDGRTATESRRFTELATGMHVQQADGSFIEASDEIVATTEGAALLGTRHRVYFPSDLGQGALRVVLPDGKELNSRPLGLSFADGKQTVMVAELKPSVRGQLMPSKRRVVYADAFVGVRADYVVSVSKSGMEADVIFREQVAGPETYNLDRDAARLQVLTEFFGTVEPVQRRVDLLAITAVAGGTSNNPHRAILPDTELLFGTMIIGAGKAFGTSDGQSQSPSARVSKSWTKLDSGRKFLTEEVLFERVRPQLQKLPQKQAASGQAPLMGLGRPSSTLQLPPAREIKHERGVIELAKAELKGNGFVMDYVFYLANVYNFTFTNNTTYQVSGLVYLTGTTILEGGSVVKFDNSSSVKVVLEGPLICKTALYRPAVLTSSDDLSVGEPIGYGPPVRGAATYLEGEYGAMTDLKHVRFAYAHIAVASPSDVVFWHCQLVNCGIVLQLETSYPVQLRNVLATQCESLVGYDWGAVSLEGHHVTLDAVDTLGNVYGTLVNSLLTSIGGGLDYVYLVNSEVDSGPGVYQSAGGGTHYLAAGSRHRNVGDPNIDQALRSDFAQMTTFAPTVYENQTVSTPTLGPRDIRDTAQPDRGYHYPALDYVFAGSTANTNLTFAPGTAVGWYRTSEGWYHAGHGIHLADGMTLTFAGEATAPCYWVRCNTVTESGNDLWYGPGGITGWAWPSFSSSPQVVARFLRCSMLGNEWANHIRDDWGYLTTHATHSEFWGGALGTYNAAQHYTNCLFERMTVNINEDWPDPSFSMRNCTMIGGSLLINRFNNGVNMQAVVKECAFDGTTITTTGNSGTVDYGYNAYLVGGQQTSPAGSSNQTVASFNWQSGSLGKFYLPSGSPLIDAGSREAAAAGLYHYTTQTIQAKEADNPLDNTDVDIGYHYVAEQRVRYVWEEDFKTKGNWKPQYGGDGYIVVGDSTHYPSYATVNTSGNSTTVWAESPSDNRALYRALSSGRIGAAWHSTTSFDVTLNVSDGLRHRVAFYCWSWDGLVDDQQVEIFDDSTTPATLLDTRRVGALDLPQYIAWDIVGSARIRFSRDGSSQKAIVSGIFFGNAAPAGPTDSDFDGLADYFEDANGNGQYEAGIDVASYLLADTDRDGMEDPWELLYAFNPHVNDSGGDADGDGVSNLEEHDVRSNPRSIDCPDMASPLPNSLRNYLTTTMSGLATAGNVQPPSMGKMLFSDYNHETSTYTRNPNFWLFNLNGITAVSVYRRPQIGNNTQIQIGATLITPYHAVTCTHAAGVFQGPPGTDVWVRFVGKNNQVHEAKCIGQMAVPNNGFYDDRTILVFENPVPAFIERMRIVPDSLLRKLPCLPRTEVPDQYYPKGIPCVGWTQFSKVVGKGLIALGSGHLSGDPTTCWASYNDAVWRPEWGAWSELVGDGDSGYPSCLVINSAVCLLGTWYSVGPGTGPWWGWNVSQLNTALDSLSQLHGVPTGNYPATVDLSSFAEYP